MNRSIRTRMGGLSLIEIMVALAIGSLLILALVQVFAGSRTAYQLSAGLARTQENARFAIDILQRDLRMAGHMGCVNDQSRFLPANVTTSRPALLSTFLSAAEQFDAVPTSNYAAALEPLRFDRSIEGFNALGTSSGNTLVLTAAPVAATARENWQPALPVRLYADIMGGTAGHAVAGSDVVVLRYFMPSGAQVKEFVTGAPTTLKVADPVPLQEGDATPGLFGIADCMQAGVFNATLNADGDMSVAVGGLNRSTFDSVPQFTRGQAMVYRAESVAYYVGINSVGNSALYRLRYRVGTGGGLESVKEELVEGVESLQLQFGQDSNTTAAGRPTGNIGASVTANAVQPVGAYDSADYDLAWRRVGVVQVGLLARSPEPAAAGQRVGDGVMRLSALGVVFTPPADTHYRAVYEDTVALRNRLFGN